MICTTLTARKEITKNQLCITTHRNLIGENHE